MQESKSNRKRNGNRRSKRNGSGGSGRGNTTGSITKSGFTLKSMPFFGYRVRKRVPYYQSGVVLSGASGLAGAQIFSANGLYDPDITGTGGQPMSFDQAMTFFNHYTVHNARITVTLSSDSTTLRATAGLFISGSSTVTTNVEQLLENGDGAVQQLQYAGTMGSSATFTRSINVGRFQSVRDVMDDPNMRGDSASNPVEQAYFHIIVFNATTAAQVQCEYMAIIEYDATFHEPRKGSLS